MKHTHIPTQHKVPHIDERVDLGKNGAVSPRSAGVLPVGAVDIAYEQFGDGQDPAVLLLMGNSAPGLVWPDPFCERLASVGFQVIRFDQRDTGLSTYIDFDKNPYRLDDLVDDAFGLLKGLGVDQVHLVGLSQGGVLAYRMALARPEQVRTVTTIMSSPDLRPKNDAFAGAPAKDGELPRPAPEYVARVIALNALPPETAQDVAYRFVENFRLAKGPRSPFDEKAWQALGTAVANLPSMRRDGLRPAMANNSNHSRAQVLSSQLRPADLARIQNPVLIVHGSDDPIFPVEHAYWAAAHIPYAGLLILEKMGHALDTAFFTPINEALTGFWRQQG